MSRVNFKCVLITRPWLAGGGGMAILLHRFHSRSFRHDKLNYRTSNPTFGSTTNLQHYDVTRRDSSGGDARIGPSSYLAMSRRPFG
jgi:hypothetical protein